MAKASLWNKITHSPSQSYVHDPRPSVQSSSYTNDTAQPHYSSNRSASFSYNCDGAVAAQRQRQSVREEFALPSSNSSSSVVRTRRSSNPQPTAASSSSSSPKIRRNEYSNERSAASSSNTAVNKKKKKSSSSSTSLDPRGELVYQDGAFVYINPPAISTLSQELPPSSPATRQTSSTASSRRSLKTATTRTTTKLSSSTISSSNQNSSFSSAPIDPTFKSPAIKYIAAPVTLDLPNTANEATDRRIRPTIDDERRSASEGSGSGSSYGQIVTQRKWRVEMITPPDSLVEESTNAYGDAISEERESKASSESDSDGDVFYTPRSSFQEESHLPQSSLQPTFTLQPPTPLTPPLIKSYHPSTSRTSTEPSSLASSPLIITPVFDAEHDYFPQQQQIPRLPMKSMLRAGTSPSSDIQGDFQLHANSVLPKKMPLSLTTGSALDRVRHTSNRFSPTTPESVKSGHSTLSSPSVYSQNSSRGGSIVAPASTLTASALGDRRSPSRYSIRSSSSPRISEEDAVDNHTPKPFPMSRPTSTYSLSPSVTSSETNFPHWSHPEIQSQTSETFYPTYNPNAPYNLNLPGSGTGGYYRWRHLSTSAAHSSSRNSEGFQYVGGRTGSVFSVRSAGSVAEEENEAQLEERRTRRFSSGSILASDIMGFRKALSVRSGGSDVGASGVISTTRLPQVMSQSYEPTGNGYSTLVLPKGDYKPTDPTRFSTTVDLATHGLASTTMATISLTSTSPTSTVPSQFYSPPIYANFNLNVPPPVKVTSDKILVRVWAVALDGIDASIARTSPKGWIPGRSFVGKVLEVGASLTKGEFTRGDLVFGLVDVKKSGSLSEMVLVDRRHLAVAPKPSGEGLSLEHISALPLLGVTAHRTCANLSRGSKALLLGAEDGVGFLILQELFKKGVEVYAQIRTTAIGGEAPGEVRDRVQLFSKEVFATDDVMSAVGCSSNDQFDFVVDTHGGRDLFYESRRILTSNGQFITTKGDSSSIPPLMPMSSSWKSLKRNFSKKDSKSVGYENISLSPDVDSHGEDIRDILEWITATSTYIPLIGPVVPFEKGGTAFDAITGAGNGGKVGCEKEVWVVRMIS